MPCFVRSSASSNLIAPRPHLLQEPDAEPSGTGSWMFCNCAQLLHGRTIVTYHVFQVPQRQPLLQLLQQLQQQLLWLDRQRFRRARRRRSWGTGHFFFAINLGSCEFESQEDEASWPTENPWGLEWLELGMFFWKTWPTWKLCFVRWCNRQGCWTIYSSDCTSNFCATKMLPCIWQIISEAHQHLERGYMLRHFFRNQDDLGWLATAYVGGKWYSHTLSWLHLRLSRTSTTGRNPCRNWPSKSRLVCAKPLRSRWTSLPPGRKGVGVGVGTHVERPYSH